MWLSEFVQLRSRRLQLRRLPGADVLRSKQLSRPIAGLLRFRCYQTQAYDDPNGYSDESQSEDSNIAAAQERLARQGYYRGETDGVLSAEMQKAVRRYQSTNGLRQTGYLDSDTLAVMGLTKTTSY